MEVQPTESAGLAVVNSFLSDEPSDQKSCGQGSHERLAWVALQPLLGVAGEISQVLPHHIELFA